MSDSPVSILEINMADAPIMKPVMAGEYVLVCKKAVHTLSKTDNPMIKTQWEIEGKPTAPDLFHYTNLPVASDEEKDKNVKLSNLRKLMEALGLPLATQINLENFNGRRCWANIVEESSDSFGDSNKIKSFIKPA